METIVLEAEKRTKLGKKVKSLRREGMTPANIFGHSVTSQAIEINTDAAEKVLAKAGATHMITIQGASFEESRKVLTKGVQRHPLTGKLLHVDFHQVSMTEKVKVEVPLVFGGESPAARSRELIMLENLRAIEVECLPNDIPGSIEIDLTPMAAAGDHILVSELKLPEGVTVLTNPEDVVAKVEVSRAAVEEVAEEAEAEGEAPATGETAAEAA